MRVRLLLVPYDSALRGVRMGRGPGHLVRLGLADSLAEAGHEVDLRTIESPPDVSPAEIRTAFELARALAGEVEAARAEGAFPLVLAGNCGTAVGTVAGLGDGATAVVWLDAHGDFNTPETTVGGFLDGMALATLTGRCWRQLSARVPGFRPVPDEQVVLVGARDLDPLEAELLGGSALTLVPPAGTRSSQSAPDLGRALDAACARARRAYVHLDLDVLDSGEGRANEFAAPDGLLVEDVEEVFRLVRQRIPLAAAAVTAYDPVADTEGRVGDAAVRLCGTLVALADAVEVP